MLVTDDRDKITVTSTDLAVDILVEHTWPALVSLTSGQVRAAAAPGRPVTGTPQ